MKTCTIKLKGISGSIIIKFLSTFDSGLVYSVCVNSVLCIFSVQISSSI